MPQHGFGKTSAVVLGEGHSPLNAGQDGRNIIRRTPSVLEDVQAELSRSVDVRVEHLADELDAGRFVGVLLFEMHDKAKGAILERGVRWADDDGVPLSRNSISILVQRLGDDERFTKS